ncbi:hypothetical protein [Fodinibius halophilus]|uniref:Uncharacterized protein n=1 Tax=Fodinibius halophilus TaxID=1736908 RepID=A0A6M1THP3_9BACT|nr:hypothetical protein [Fodinibius halophilus]NGP90254.1 hypothetical protein [Fodinibius halophilus]
MRQFTTDSFREIDGHSYFQNLSENLRKRIKREDKEYILGVDEEEYKKYLVEELSLEPIEILKSKEKVEEPVAREELVTDRAWGNEYKKKFYYFAIKYPFKGTPELFKVAPSPRTLRSTEITVYPQRKIVEISFKISEKNPKAFKNAKNKKYIDAFVNVDNINKQVANWNRNLRQKVESFFESTKKEYLEENEFYEAINVSVDEDTKSVFSVPTIKKKEVPKPSKSDGKSISSEPIMSDEMYEDAIKILYDVGKKMERKPSLYKDKDEEGIRDQFLLFLETRYEGTTATGETFNKKGKTDILLKYSEDGTNLFVAECKFWKGIKAFFEAINQLFDRYLTWRDSKVSVILFVQNKNFSNVLDEIRNKIEDHQYYLRENGENGESSYSYIFSLPDDPDKEVYLEVMAFHFPE